MDVESWRCSAWSHETYIASVVFWRKASQLATRRQLRRPWVRHPHPRSSPVVDRPSKQQWRTSTPSRPREHVSVRRRGVIRTDICFIECD